MVRIPHGQVRAAIRTRAPDLVQPMRLPIPAMLIGVFARPRLAAL